MIEHGLQQVHLGLHQISLRLGHQKACRQSDLEAPLLWIEALFGHCCAGPRRIDPFGRALYLARRLSDALRGVELQACDPLRCLPPLESCPDESGLIVASPERIARRETDTPG